MIKKIIKYSLISVVSLFIILISIGIYYDSPDSQFNSDIVNRISQLSISDKINKSNDEEFFIIQSSFTDSLNLYKSLSYNIDFSDENKLIFDKMIGELENVLISKEDEINLRKKEEEEKKRIDEENRIQKEIEERKKKSIAKYCFTKKPYISGSSRKISLKFYNNGKFKMFFDYGEYYYEGSYKYKNESVYITKDWLKRPETQRFRVVRNCTNLRGPYGWWWNGDKE
tara:strand:+ start:3394 stop:4074 length:681 start_codon:yes stop_codon:yes gene_type:complete